MVKVAFLLGLLLSSSIPAIAEDAGLPVFYVRGEFNGWGVSESHCFSRNGNIYSISLNSLSGEFKISNDDWTINFGASSSEDINISESRKVNGLANGLNYYANSLNDVRISFEYNPQNPSLATISFSVNGEDPEDPVNPDYRPSGLSGTLPVLYINVYNADGGYDDEIISKDLNHKNYFKGEYWLETNGCEWLEKLGAKSIATREEPLPLEIKARGNYTRIGFSKKPFKLKLGSKQSLLGLSKSKHFAILAHADDNFGYMRNFAGFNLGKRIGLPWTPSQQPVEVVINGDYRGLYFLTESIRVESDRVNIQELDDNETDASIISGGYLIELDNYDEDNQIRMEEKGQAPGFKDMLRITFDTPEEYSDLQRMFVNDQFVAMNDAIGENSDRLWSYMDLDDAARYYIVEEVMSHTESYHGSTYMFRDRGANQKWHFSPLWDFGNGFNGSSNNYFTADSPFGNTWIASMRMNGKFMEKVKETWRWFMSQKYSGIEADLEEYCSHLKSTAEADYRRWHDQPLPDSWQASPVVDNRDMDGRLSDVKRKLREKTEWLAGQFGNYNDGFYAEPERDNTEAAPLPEYITTDISEIISPECDDSEMRFYTLQGVRVKNPVSGNVYIIQTSGRSYKVMY